MKMRVPGDGRGLDMHGWLALTVVVLGGALGATLFTPGPGRGHPERPPADEAQEPLSGEAAPWWEGMHVYVIVDGEVTRGPSDLASIPRERIERIEVWRGDALRGPDRESAAKGFVQVYLKSP